MKYLELLILQSTIANFSEQPGDLYHMALNIIGEIRTEDMLLNDFKIRLYFKVE